MRRRLAIGLGLAALLARPGEAAPPAIGFRVLREGAEVGTHRVRFRDAAGLLEVASEVRITVRLMGFTVYRYAHDTEEAWRGERLVSLDSRLEKNGTVTTSAARAEGAGLRLRGAAGEALLPAEAAPLTWWRAETLRPGVPLFDPRGGRAVMPRIERAARPGGVLVRVIGGEGAEVLYDAAGTWVGFATTGEDGSAVRYERA